jgi:putative FmdB family regulatory protein
MPIYEYKCAKCGVVEVTQRITESPLKKCPNCKSKVERLISHSSFVLKGSGWYATDYANKGKEKSEPSGDSAPTNGTTSTDSSTKSEAKADSKPAASESKPAPEKSSPAKAAD